MDKLTLDTNILRDWAWCEGRSAEIRYNDDCQKKDELGKHFTKLSAFGIEVFVSWELQRNFIPIMVKVEVNSLAK